MSEINKHKWHTSSTDETDCEVCGIEYLDWLAEQTECVFSKKVINSIVKSLEYNPSNKMLKVNWQSGGYMIYTDVTKETYNSMVN